MDGNQKSMPELPAPQSAEKPLVPGELAKPAGEAPAPVGESLRTPPPISPTVSDDASQIAQPISSTGIAPISDPSTSQQAIADDVDVIEKQWVVNAKNIVEKTRNDPREQSKELSRFKAEYVQKRFNKELKVAEDAV